MGTWWHWEPAIWPRGRWWPSDTTIMAATPTLAPIGWAVTIIRGALVTDGSSWHTAGTGYRRAADAYVRGRPSYPDDAVRWIVDRAGPDDGLVADLGAGAGAFTALLAQHDRQVVAVEPVETMLQRCPQGLLRCSAEAGHLPFPDATLDAITAATAFHWFATTEVLDEFHRCLLDDAPLLLAWNERDGRVDWVAAHNALVDPYAGDTPRFITMRWKTVLDAHPGFAEREYAEFPNPAPMTRQGLVDRILSTSFIAALPDQERDHVHTRAIALAEDLPEIFDYPYLTRIWHYTRRAR